MTWLNCNEDPPIRTFQGSTWGGMSWGFDASDAADIHAKVTALTAQHDALKREATAIPNKVVSGPWLVKLSAVEKQLSTIYRQASAAAYETKASFESVMQVLDVAIPKTLAIIAPLIAADRGDPTGKTSLVIVKDANKQREATAVASKEAWEIWDDPKSWITKTVQEGGKGIRDAQWFIFKEWLKVMWPWLLIGGGVLGTFYFWPLISRFLLKRRAGLGGGVKAGMLPPGTVPQPGGSTVSIG